MEAHAATINDPYIRVSHPARLPLPAAVRLDLPGEPGAVAAAVPGEIACRPPRARAAGEPWPPAGCLDDRVVSRGPDLLVPPSGRARRRGWGRLRPAPAYTGCHAGFRSSSRVPSGHVAG